MKKVLLATSALAATTGLAFAQAGELTVSGTASMGILGGDWVSDRRSTREVFVPGQGVMIEGGDVRDDQSEYELLTDIDVTFTMSGQTDTGLTFGASIDLDESDGSGSGVGRDLEGASPAFAGRTEGGETIFISGGFGTLTMGDTDGALDWALQDIAIGGSIGDLHTTHAGYSGNGIADDDQIARYDYSFGDFDVALSAQIDDNGDADGGADALAVGAKYNASLAAMELGVGLGYTQLDKEGKEDDALGVSLDAHFNNGFRAILNWVDRGAANNTVDQGEQYIGLGLGYTVDDWTIAANWGEYSRDVPGTDNDPGQSGFALVVNYDLGGGAEVQLGYSKASCGEHGTFDIIDVNDDCDGGTEHLRNVDGDRISLGVAMNF